MIITAAIVIRIIRITKTIRTVRIILRLRVRFSSSPVPSPLPRVLLLNRIISLNLIPLNIIIHIDEITTIINITIQGTCVLKQRHRNHHHHPTITDITITNQF